MDELISPSVQLYQVSTALVDKAMRDIDDEQALQRIDGHTNCLMWLFGHLAVARCNLAGMLGMPQQVGWMDTFTRGSDGNNTGAFPKLVEVHAVWQDITKLLLERFETLTGEELSAAAPRNFPVADKTIRGAISFLAWHEGYHVGQLAYLRKSLRHERLTS